MSSIGIRTRIFVAVLATVGALAAPTSSQAQTYNNGSATATFLVSLTIIANCTITAAPMTFAQQGVLATNVDATSNLSITCTNSTPYNLGLDAGNTASSTIANRLLASTTAGSTATVPYNLYTTATRDVVWGNVQGTNTVGGVGTGAAVTRAVYGRVLPQTTTPAPGTYTSTVTATVFF